jgi:hypothetical protein
MQPQRLKPRVRARLVARLKSSPSQTVQNLCSAWTAAGRGYAGESSNSGGCGYVSEGPDSRGGCPYVGYSGKQSRLTFYED